MKQRGGISMAKKRRIMIGPVAWYIYDLTGHYPINYRHQDGGTAGTVRGHEYKAWLVNGVPYVYVDNQRIKVMVGDQNKSWTKAKVVAASIIQHVEKIEKEVAA